MMDVSTDILLEHYRIMLLSRRIEERLRSAYMRGLVAGGVYLGIGQESLSAAAGMQLREGDIFAPLIRDNAGRVAFGEDPLNGFRVYMGKATGNMRGRDGNIHRGDTSTGLMPMISHLGAMIPVVAGSLMARRLAGKLSGNDLSIGICSIGDGSMGTGATHEGLNVIGVEKLPVVALVANNQVAYSTFNDRSFACKHLVDRAAAYGFAGHTCDGEDPIDCLSVLKKAVAAARAGEGPQMVVASLLRGSGHGEHDDATYVPQALKEKARDCLTVGEEMLKQRGEADTIAAMEAPIKEQIDAWMEQAESDPEPDPDREDWCAYSERWLTQGLRP